MFSNSFIIFDLPFQRGGYYQRFVIINLRNQRRIEDPSFLMEIYLHPCRPEKELRDELSEFPYQE